MKSDGFPLKIDLYTRVPDNQFSVSFDPVANTFEYRVLKRLVDLVLASLGLLILIPVFILTGCIIKLTSPGPIFYAWDVIGCGGRAFRGYKFRSMVQNADTIKPKLLGTNEMKGPVFKMKNDPRITPFGRILRKYSIDELPQLWSVINGDMTLVGPRPAGPLEWAKYEAWQRRKLSVTPGITCLWQVSGRNEINDFNEWVRLDLEYINNWSLWLDFKILFWTLFVVLKGTGI